MWVAASGLSFGPWVSDTAGAEVRVVDDFGRDVVLGEPARRILSLAPHVTENLFTAGAGDRVVGVVDHSDFPPEAEKLPSLGSYVRFNIEAALALAPDLVVAWRSNSNGEMLDHLERHGITVYFSEPRTFDGVVENIRELALLAGTEDAVDPRLDQALGKIAEARDRFSDRPVLDVFYQIWSEPLITLNGEHFISRILEVCGARNLFADLPIIAPRVSLEAVIEANPDVIITGLRDGVRPDMSFWRKWTMVKAVDQDRFVYVDSDVMHRHTLRMLLGVPEFCTQVDAARRGESG